MSEIEISVTWSGTTAIEVPDGEDVESAVAAVNSGDWPRWVSQQVDSSTAEMTDWNARAVRR